MTATGTVANAAASGKLFATPTFAYTTLPMNWFPAITICGAMKSPSVSANVKIEPATSAGNASGRITRRNVRPALPPRSEDASSSESGIRSSPAYSGRIMYGSQRYEKTMHAGDVAEPGPVSPNGSSSQFSGPLSWRMIRQA